MKTIYKHVIGSTPDIVSGAIFGAKIYVPADSKVLCCKVQNDTDVCVWVELDSEKLDRSKGLIQSITIRLFGTGWDMNCLKDKKYEYLDTIYIGQGGVFVYHAYAIFE